MKTFKQFHEERAFITEGMVADLVSAIRTNLRLLDSKSQAFFDTVAKDSDVLAILSKAGSELSEKELRKLQSILVRKYSIKHKMELEILMQDLHYAVRNAS